ncbi:MAG: HAMP domain-containing histidine kinase [Chlorobi bacterium]|nr:HAMP domain-containing histidine kinase [Chlorobiota bacterium]
MKQWTTPTRIKIIAAIVFGSAACAWAQDYVTIIRTVKVNGHPVSERLWKSGIEIRPEDYIEWRLGVTASNGDTIEATSYLVELRYDSISHYRTMTTPHLEYKGLERGDYSLRIQAQLGGNATVAPILIRFRVGTTRSVERNTPSQAGSEPPNGSESNMPFPLPLWIAVALASSIISLILAGLLLHSRRRSRLTSSEYDQLHNELSTAHEQIRTLEAKRAELERTVAELRATLSRQLEQAEHHNRELREQNLKLQQQVERLQNAKKQLEQLQAEKDALFGMIIHDIKNPLMIIESLVQLLRSYDTNSVETQQILNDLAQTTSRIVALSQQVSRLLAVERSDGIPLELQQVNLAEILRSVIHRNTYLARKKNIQIIEEVPSELVTECDPQRIEEVFDNLISNAIKYSHADSVVIVRAYSVDNKHAIEIEDHGVGMSEDDMQKLFEPGSQLSSTPTAGEPSSGIGLWIVRRILERHQGTIAVRSRKGEGTTVTVTLPIEPTRATANGN